MQTDFPGCKTLVWDLFVCGGFNSFSLNGQFLCLVFFFFALSYFFLKRSFFFKEEQMHHPLRNLLLHCVNFNEKRVLSVVLQKDFHQEVLSQEQLKGKKVKV